MDLVIGIELEGYARLNGEDIAAYHSPKRSSSIEEGGIVWFLQKDSSLGSSIGLCKKDENFQFKDTLYYVPVEFVSQPIIFRDYQYTIEMIEDYIEQAIKNLYDYLKPFDAEVTFLVSKRCGCHLHFSYVDEAYYDPDEDDDEDQYDEDGDIIPRGSENKRLTLASTVGKSRTFHAGHGRAIRNAMFQWIRENENKEAYRAYQKQYYRSFSSKQDSFQLRGGHGSARHKEFIDSEDKGYEWRSFNLSGTGSSIIDGDRFLWTDEAESVDRDVMAKRIAAAIGIIAKVARTNRTSAYRISSQVIMTNDTMPQQHKLQMVTVNRRTWFPGTEKRYTRQEPLVVPVTTPATEQRVHGGRLNIATVDTGTLWASLQRTDIDEVANFIQETGETTVIVQGRTFIGGREPVPPEEIIF